MKINPPKFLDKSMLAYRVPRNLHLGEAFDLRESLVTYKSVIEGYEARNIYKETQFKKLKELMGLYKEERLAEKIYTEEPTISCFTSIMSDMNAKLLALNLCIKSGKQYLWHQLTGGIYDSLIPNGMKSVELPNDPDIIVVYNVMYQIDGYRIQKLRDILERYCDRHIIICMTEGDPYNLFFRMGLELSCCAYIK